MVRPHFAAPLLLAVLAASLSSQAGPAPHPAPAPRLGTLHPVLGSFHLVMMRRVPPEGVFRPFGDVSLVRDSARLGDVAVLRNIVDYDWGSGRHTLDSTVALVGTLAPLSERTRTPSRIVAYDFHALRVRGQLGPFDSLRAIDDTLPGPAFNSTDLDALVTALSLHRHFQVVVPLYDPEYPGFRPATLQVTGAAEVRTREGRRRVWLLSMREGTHPTLHYQIDVVTRRLWQKEFSLPSGVTFRIRDAALLGP